MHSDVCNVGTTARVTILGRMTSLQLVNNDLQVLTELTINSLLEGKRDFTFLPPTKEEVNAFARVCLSACLSVSKITQKHVVAITTCNMLML